MLGNLWIGPSLVLAATPPAVTAVESVFDQADEQYNFVAGLFERGLHDMVVQEGAKFLREHPRHERTTLVRYRLGQSYYELSRFEDAKDALLPLEQIRDFEFAREATFRLGQSLLELGENEAASQRFLTLCGQNADHYLVAAAAYFAGEAMFRDERYVDAARAYARALDAKPDDAMTRASLYGLGWALYRAGQFATATSAFETYLQRFADQDAHGEVRFLLGECAMEQADAEAALQHYTKVPKGDYHDDALSGAGFAAESLEQYPRAAQLFLRLETEVPDSPLLAEAQLHAGICCYHAEQWDLARATLDRLLQSGDATWFGEACYWRGQVAAKAQGPEAALVYYDQALRDTADEELRTRLQLARSDALFDAGRFDEAEAGYSELGGGSGQAGHSAAVAALNAGQFDRALELSTAILGNDGGGTERLGALLVQGESLFALERWQPSARAFELALAETQPQERSTAAERARALSRIAWCSFYLEQYESAEDSFRQLANEFPADPRAEEASFLEGRCALRRGAAERAESILRGHLEAWPRSEFGADVRYDLAQALQQLGREQEASRMLEAVAAVGEDAGALGMRARFERAELAEQAGDHERAEQLLRALIAEEPPLELRRAALYAHAWSCFQLVKLDDADRSLRLLFTRDVGPGENKNAALELLVSVARDRKDAATAQNAYRMLLESAPESENTAEAALVTALACKESDDAAAARALLDDALTRWPKFSGRDRVLYERAFLARDQGDPERFLADLAELERSHGDGALASEAAFFRGEALFEAEQWTDAAAAYRGALAADSRVRDLALYKTAWCHFRSEEWVRAAQQFAAVPRNHPDSLVAGESWFLAGEALYRAEQFGDAAELLLRFVGDYPQHESLPKGLFRLGLCHGEQEQWQECLGALNQLESKEPEFEHALESALWQGRALAALGRGAEAERRFQKVLDGERGVLAARAHLGLGDLFAERGDDRQALGEYLKVALLFDDEQEAGDALFAAGATLERQGDAEQARKQYEDLLRRFPEHPRAAEARRRLEGSGEEERSER